jgi:sugar phosphate isomerase/epimerase
LCASIHRLAAFSPSAVICLTGPAGSLDASRARELVVDGLRTLAAEAERASVSVAVEPFQQIGIDDWSIIGTLAEAAALIDEVGSRALGIQFDVWHLWNTPDLIMEIARFADRIVGVHVCDYREPTRGWADRVLPGEGVADVPGILAALDDAGWDGFYDLEIFSDDGTFGAAFEGSYWELRAEELARRGFKAFERCWRSRQLSLRERVEANDGSG